MLVTGITRKLLIMKEMLSKNKNIIFSTEVVQDDAGEDCEWNGSYWHVKGYENQKCVNRVSYYQWIPYILLIQVSLTQTK